MGGPFIFATDDEGTLTPTPMSGIVHEIMDLCKLDDAARLNQYPDAHDVSVRSSQKMTPQTVLLIDASGTYVRSDIDVIGNEGRDVCAGYYKSHRI